MLIFSINHKKYKLFDNSDLEQRDSNSIIEDFINTHELLEITHIVIHHSDNSTQLTILLNAFKALEMENVIYDTDTTNDNPFTPPTSHTKNPYHTEDPNNSEQHGNTEVIGTNNECCCTAS